MVATFSGSVTVNALPPPPGDGLSVTLTRADTGTVITYTQTESTALGSYVDPAPFSAFTQQSFVAPIKSAFAGMRIWFRPDATSSRQEVIFEYGDPTSLGGTQPTAVNSPGYTARIYDGTTLLYTSPAIPIHYWLTRWRWQSAIRPIRMTPAQALATGIFPNIASPPDVSSVRTNLAPQVYTIMGRAGLEKGMPSGGDKPDIGIITEWCADWLSTGAIPSTVLAQGEAIGSADIIIRNPTTYQPLNVEVAPYLTAGMAAGSPSPFIPKGIDPQAFVWDYGHTPQPSVLPFVITGDPYFLEHLQFGANRNILALPPLSRHNQVGRYNAWPLRDHLYAYKVTPDTIPGWLLPKSSFQTRIEKYRQSVVTDMANPESSLAVFRFRSFPAGPNDVPYFPSKTAAPTWSDTFETCVYALAVQHGLTAWIPQLEWHADSVIKRCSGTDGYYRATPNPYRCVLYYTANLTVAATSASTTLTLDSLSGEPWPTTPFVVVWNEAGSNEEMLVTAKTGNVFTVTRGYNGTTPKASSPIGTTIRNTTQFTSWAQLAARQQGVDPPRYTGFDPSDPTGNAVLRHGTPVDIKGNAGYCTYALTALGMVTSLGVSNSAAAEVGYDWLHGQLNLWKTSTFLPWRNWDVKKTAP